MEVGVPKQQGDAKQPKVPEQSSRYISTFEDEGQNP